MRRSLALFSGLSSDSTVPAGSLAKASSVGANTVNGPAPFSVVTRSAAVSAAASVLNEPAATAVSTMSFDCADTGAAPAATTAATANAAAANEPITYVFNIFCSPCVKPRLNLSTAHSMYLNVVQLILPGSKICMSTQSRVNDRTRTATNVNGIQNGHPGSAPC